MTGSLTVEDIAELRKQGDFREFLRMRLAANQAPAEVVTVMPVGPAEPGRRSGAWPTGTRPPERTRIGTPEEWAQAVHAYRAWLAAGQPATPIRCECGCTPGIRQETS